MGHAAPNNQRSLHSVPLHHFPLGTRLPVLYRGISTPHIEQGAVLEGRVLPTSQGVMLATFCQPTTYVAFYMTRRVRKPVLLPPFDEQKVVGYMMQDTQTTIHLPFNREGQVVAGAIFGTYQMGEVFAWYEAMLKKPLLAINKRAIGSPVSGLSGLL